MGIRDQLVQKGYSFYLFDMALLLYAQKAGIDLDQEKKDSNDSIFIQKSPLAKFAVSAISAIPVVSWVANVL